MIKLKHYIAHWRYFNPRYYNCCDLVTTTYTNCERFLDKEKAVEKVTEELLKFKSCPLADVDWFKKEYLKTKKLRESFYIEECDEIY